jgi:two-component system response regulator PilR (NtrC family)
VRSIIAKLARTQAPVIIAGESGSGKELAARQIHRLGARRSSPFVPVNCGAIPENLMESEFFGYRKAASRRAQEDRGGSSRPPTAARCFSTKWPSCRCRCR